MNLQTIRTVCEKLNVSESAVRRAVKNKKLPSLQLGNRLLVDMDTAAGILEPMKKGLTIEELSKATGLTQSGIYRAVREGWLPYEKNGKRFIFQLDEVMKAIEKRMAEA